MHRGPGIARGYWNKPDKTREAFTEDGWWRSGDAGYMDDEGFCYFVERIKDLIIASGYNIAPVEVENHLFRHPAVLDAAVIGVPDEYRGETVKAYVVLKPGSAGEVSEDDIIQYCRDKMAVYKAPKMVEFIEELPKTQTGKVLRRLLREKHEESSRG
jgi:long-chain acyl-CoA synthetase